MATNSAELTLSTFLSLDASAEAPGAQVKQSNQLQDMNKYLEIGRGGCGVVFQSPGKETIALKLYEHNAYPASERYDAGRLGQDYEQHLKIQQAFLTTTKAQDDLPIVPRLLAFLPGGEEAQILERRKYTVNIPASNEDFWTLHEPEMPDYWRPRRGNDMLISERIPALSQPIRERPVDLYCPRIDELRKTVLNSTNDRDCMIRLYLGKRTDKQRKLPSRFFTLRNYKLHLDHALDEQNGLGWNGVQHYAKMMARGLATCHWAAGVDANDVEFVLGGAPSAVHEFSKSADFKPRPAHLWMLDFDKSVDMMDYTREGMARAAYAAEYNDPYFPRPCTEEGLDGLLWDVFASEYASQSRLLIGRDSAWECLPEMFLAEWCRLRLERVRKMDEAALKLLEEKECS